MHSEFTTRERIRRLLALARQAETDGRSRQARNFRRMAQDLRPARVPDASRR